MHTSKIVGTKPVYKFTHTRSLLLCRPAFLAPKRHAACGCLMCQRWFCGNRVLNHSETNLCSFTAYGVGSINCGLHVWMLRHQPKSESLYQSFKSLFNACIPNKKTTSCIREAAADNTTHIYHKQQITQTETLVSGLKLAQICSHTPTLFLHCRQRFIPRSANANLAPFSSRFMTLLTSRQVPLMTAALPAKLLPDG